MAKSTELYFIHDHIDYMSGEDILHECYWKYNSNPYMLFLEEECIGMYLQKHRGFRVL